MPSFVSKDHMTLIKRCRRLYQDFEVIGWPDAEVNIGRLVGLSDANLRGDIFIRFSDREAVVIEWQSSIHALEESTEWHNKDDIAGRDNLKRQMCAKSGVGLLELWTLDMSDEKLMEMIDEKKTSSHLTDTAIRSLDNHHSSFGSSDGFKQGDSFGKAESFGSKCDTFESRPFGEESSFAAGPGFKSTAFTKRERQ